MEQRTDDWYNARCGKITASRISDVMAKPESASYKGYRAELVAERLTGEPTEGYSNDYMERGTELESEAREAYEADQMVEVREVGFIQHPELDYAGASPDGVVGDGLAEIKCRKTHLHLEYILNDRITPKENRQIQWQMACTGAKWCDFVSYDPRLKGHELFIKRIERDDELIKEITERVKQLDSEVNEIIENLNKR
jgi:putative phage-type endonuclease